MRPKRRILLIDRNEARHSVTRFVLEQHAFVVISARDLDEAEKLSQSTWIDLALGFEILNDRRMFEMASEHEFPSLLILNEQREMARSTVLVNPSMTDLIQAIKTGTVRKRGPKSMKKPVAAQVGMEAAAA